MKVCLCLNKRSFVVLKHFYFMKNERKAKLKRKMTGEFTIFICFFVKIKSNEFYLCLLILQNIMITALQLKQSQLDQLYDWVDGLKLSRPKKNISRDFSDGVLMAQTVYNFYPKIVEMHNYPPGNSYKVKLTNWQTLKNKVLHKLGIQLNEDDCSRLATASPLAIQAVLYEVKRVVDDAIFINGNENSPQKSNNQNSYSKQQNDMQVNEKGKNPKNLYTSSKVQELKQILGLIKQKINIVEKSVERKDIQIRQLEQILKQSEN